AGLRRRGWVPWLAAGVAAAAAVLVALWWQGDAAIAPRAPLQIGDHVAILAAPGTAYRVVRSDAAGTEIAVEHGAVTARLWRTAQPYRLPLSGGGAPPAAGGPGYSPAGRAGRAAARAGAGARGGPPPAGPPPPPPPHAR